MNRGTEMDTEKLRKRKLMSSSSSACIVRKNGCGYIDVVGDGKNDQKMDESWKNESMRSSSCILTGVIADVDSGKSVGDEEERFQPLGLTIGSANATVSGGVTGRKRVRLHGKEKSESGDNEPVPRKVRSAINNTKKQSMSPPQAYAKKKRHITSHLTQVPFGSGPMNSNDSLLLDSITEDEKEVVQALYKLSRLVVLQPTNKIELKETMDFKVSGKTSPTPSEVQVLKDKDHQLTYDGVGAQGLLFTTEKLVKETVNSEVAVVAKPLICIGSHTSEPVINKPHQSYCHTTVLSSKKGNQDSSNISNYAVNSPTFVRISDDYCSENCVTQPIQPDALPIGSAKVSCEVQAVKKYVGNIELVSRKPTEYQKSSSYEPNAPCTAKGQLEL